MNGHRELAVYDGRECIGKIAIAANKKARAFDSRGKSLGTFENFEAASAALRTFCAKGGVRGKIMRGAGQQQTPEIAR
jgi:hypothetical protein